ncbi:MAG: aldo/keto reductase [Burkholderiaceae bacterium]|nr:aldo/keto reductase [Burkholderiaceae bacterium]
MTFKPVGASGLAIAPLVFGGNVFGWTADQNESFAILDRLLDAGLTTIDTADVYSRWHPGNQGGESETILGAWLASRGTRHRIQLITKVGMDQGLSAAHIERAVEASLKRLQTDHIDLYFSHRWDGDTPQTETLAAYDRLIRAGKVRAIGASNFTAQQVRAALDVARRENLPRYQILEPEYSLAERTRFEGPLADVAIEQGLAVIPYYALASGFLTGKYRAEADLGGRARADRVRQYLNPRGLRILAALDAVAARHRAQPAAVALAWLMRRPGVTAPIASASRVAQVDALVQATQLALTDEDMAQLTLASSPQP